MRTKTYNSNLTFRSKYKVRRLLELLSNLVCNKLRGLATGFSRVSYSVSTAFLLTSQLSSNKRIGFPHKSTARAIDKDVVN